MGGALNAIQRPIQAELQDFERKFRESVKSDVALVDRVMLYIVKRKGKQVRPMFVFLAAKLCGGTGEATHTAASLIELLHTATLVHDDVVDDADLRRGFFSINHLWKNKIAVLVGDYLLSRGLLLSLERNQTRILEITSRAVKEMAEGELLQMEKARRLDIKESVYYDIIRRKTASLIAASCAAGAASATDDQDCVDRMHAFGEKIGIAFQIKDDLFDYGPMESGAGSSANANGVAPANTIGKPTGIDIKERKMTLPLIYALQQADAAQRRRIIRLVKGGGDDRAKVEEVMAFVRESGGMQYAEKAMYRYQEQAFELLRSFPESESRDSMEQLVRYVTEREK